MALNLKRKPGQGILLDTLDGPVWIYVAHDQPCGSQVALAISAPEEVKIFREENLEDKGPLYREEAYKIL